MIRDPLAVYLYGRYVADIIDAGFGDTAVQYTSDAATKPVGCRLSLSLPVQDRIHPTAGPGGRWVRSLLPEGRALAWAVEAFGIPENDRFGLIAVLGPDVAGAVQVLDANTERRGAGRYEPMSADDLAAVVGRAHRFGLGLDRTRGVRLSLAGMQDKVPLHRDAAGYHRPIEGAPSTVIVKPEPIGTDRPDGIVFDGLATIELYCLVLARRCRLEVPDARVEQFGDTTALVVDRFDRTVDPSGQVERIHQEDLLGALGLDPLLKYERPHAERVDPGRAWADAAATVSRRGPSLANLAQVLIDHVGVANIGPFLRALTFNVAIGNADAHARNYSVLLPQDGTVRLTPLYDLICTRVWPDLDADAAQLVAGEDDIDRIRATHVIDEATSWGVPRRIATSRVEETLDAVAANYQDAIGACVDLGGEERHAVRAAEYIAGHVDAMRAGDSA